MAFVALFLSDGEDGDGQVLVVGEEMEPLDPNRIRSDLRLSVLDDGLGSMAWQGMAGGRRSGGMRWWIRVVEAMASICGSGDSWSSPVLRFLGFRSVGDLTVMMAGLWTEIGSPLRCGDGGAVAAAVLAWLWCSWNGLEPCSFLAGPGASWAWAWPLALNLFNVLLIFYCFLFLVNCGLEPAISPFHFMVGRYGLGPGMHLQCAWSGLARRRAIYFKWTQPPRSRKKLSVAGFISVRQHSGKAVLFAMMLLRYRVIFPVCHRYLKANRVAIRVLFANWCLSEYIDFVESLGIISGCSLYAYCNLGFRLYVPPLYSAISLIKA